MIKVLPVSFSVLLMLSGVATAANLDACSGAEETSSSSTFDHVDLGGGVVSYINGHFGWGFGANSLTIESCASGDTVDATFRLDEQDVLSGTRVRAFDVKDAFYAVWQDAILSDEKVTFEMLEHRFAAVGAEVKRFVDKRESCACHLAYPRLRGAREEFERIVR